MGVTLKQTCPAFGNTSAIRKQIGLTPLEMLSYSFPFSARGRIRPFFGEQRGKESAGSNLRKRPRRFSFLTGLTLLELILVLVIISIGTALAMPSMRRGIENQQAKKALETLRTIAQAVRLYEVNQGASLPANVTLETLQDGGYVIPREYAPNFEYQIIPVSGNPILVACRPNCNTATRTITLRVFNIQGNTVIKAQDGAVTDTAGFLNPNP